MPALPALSALSALLALVVPVARVALVARAPEAAAGAADCAAAGADTASVAARRHEAHEAKNIPLDGSVDPGTNRDAHTVDRRDINDVSGERAKRGDEENGNCDKRETKREPRRLRDKEVGNVVNGQRNMPEILSPCG